MSANQDAVVSPVLRPVRLCLLGGFAMQRSGCAVELPLPAQRLLALLGLRRRASRTALAGTLWPEVSETQAQGSLRTTIWRLHRQEPDLVDGGRRELALSDRIEVDVQELEAWLKGERPIDHLPRRILTGGELLPDWSDDWVLFDRERSRQLQLHALDEAARVLSTQGRFAEALAIALDSVRSEPLRESAHRRVILIHLAEGNVAEASRQYDAFAAMLRAELGVLPSRELRTLLVPAPEFVPRQRR